jgi:exopolysaccharide biosynthesis polyprenyl glycosylphosphotransferase
LLWESEIVSRRYHRLVTVVTVVTDAVLMNAAFALAYWLRYDVQWLRSVEFENYVPYSTFIPLSLLFSAILLVTFAVQKVYMVRRGRSLLDEVAALFNATTTGLVLLIVILFVGQPRFYSRLIFIFAAFSAVFVLALARSARRGVLNLLRRRGIGVDRVLIVGAGEAGRRLMRIIVAQPELGYSLVGYIDDDPGKAAVGLGRIPGLGTLETLSRIVSELGVNEVVVTLPWMYHRKILAILSECQRLGVHARIVPDLFRMSFSEVDVRELNGVPLLSVRAPAIRGADRAVKRAIDLLAASLLLLVLSPFLALIGLAVRLDSKGPILYGQERLGAGGRPFRIIKFRTMRVGAEEEQEKLRSKNEATGPLFKMRNDPRVTSVGRLLRRTSIDELPQLYNVVRGEMSLVGPRPPIPSEVKEYLEWHRKRLAVAPGMTGLWQISGRSDVTFDEMVLLDLYYIENWSLSLDFSILLRTIPRMLFGRGAY